jgi:hypothetical protein
MTNWPIPAFGSISKLIPSFAYAIGRAEGFGPLNNIPTRANNPGDLELGDIGFGILGQGITIYPTFLQGAQALYRQLDLILTNTSHEYNTSMTFSQVAVIWTGNDNPIGWAETVTKSLNILPDMTILGWMSNHG